MDARLLNDPCLPGPWNMALDESLLRSAATTGQVTLRLYGWDQPTVSLGYFQPYDARLAHPASLPCQLVRRTTGGGAIVHDRELTYSLTAPTADRRFADHQGLCDVVHQALLATLRNWSITARQFGTMASLSSNREPSTAEKEPFLCFLRRTPADLVVGSQKVCGSAQRKHRGAILQHGSLLLSQSPAAPELPGIAELTGVRLNAADVGRDLADRLARHWDLIWRPSVCEIVEIESARGLESQRYRCADWNRRR